MKRAVVEGVITLCLLAPGSSVIARLREANDAKTCASSSLDPATRAAIKKAIVERLDRMYVARQSTGATMAPPRIYAGSLDARAGRRKTPGRVIAYVDYAPICGSGGCKAYVLSNNAKGVFSIVGSIQPARLPIAALSASSMGWRSIGVTVSGGGVEHGYLARLDHHGEFYAANPTLAGVPRVAVGEDIKPIIDSASCPL